MTGVEAAGLILQESSQRARALRATATVTGMSCDQLSLTVARCTLLLAKSFSTDLDMIRLSQELFNAVNRARTNPEAFSQEMRTIGNDAAAQALAGRDGASRLEYSGTLRIVASRLFDGGNWLGFLPFHSEPWAAAFWVSGYHRLERDFRRQVFCSSRNVSKPCIRYRGNGSRRNAGRRCICHKTFPE